MSEHHLRRVEALIKNAQTFLYSIQKNEAPDLETFDQQQVEHFEALKGLGPVSLASPYMVQIRTRMAYLEELNTEMVQVIKKLLSDSRNSLQKSSSHKRGLTGYQRSLFGQSRGKGKWRGRG
jgi:hypothetical protein